MKQLTETVLNQIFLANNTHKKYACNWGEINELMGKDELGWWCPETGSRACRCSFMLREAQISTAAQVRLGKYVLEPKVWYPSASESNSQQLFLVHVRHVFWDVHSRACPQAQGFVGIIRKGGDGARIKYPVCRRVRKWLREDFKMCRFAETEDMKVGIVAQASHLSFGGWSRRMTTGSWSD